MLYRRRSALPVAPTPPPTPPPRPLDLGAPPLHGPRAGLAGGFLFGLHAFQIVADYNAVANEQRPAAWPFGLGPDAIQAHAWLDAPRVVQDAIAASVYDKLRLHSPGVVDRYLKGAERGCVVAMALKEIKRHASWRGGFAMRKAMDAIVPIEEGGRIVGPPLSDRVVARLFARLKCRSIERPTLTAHWDPGRSMLIPHGVMPGPDELTMAGTPRQVEWALKIKQPQMPGLVAYADRRTNDPDLDDEARACYGRALADLKLMPAFWWIDNRYRTVAEILDRQAKMASSSSRLGRGRRRAR